MSSVALSHPAPECSLLSRSLLTRLSAGDRVFLSDSSKQSLHLCLLKSGHEYHDYHGILAHPVGFNFYVQTINYFSEFVKRFFNFFSRSNSVWNMSASLTSITRQVSQMFDLNRRNLVQYSPLKHFFKILVQIVLTFRIFRVYYYT